MMTWIVVANRTDAKIFKGRGPGQALERVMTLPHPEGRLKEHELVSDRSGRGFMRGSPARATFDSEQSATERLADEFADKLAGVLEEGRTHQSFDRLILIAERKFLGRVKKSLDRPTLECVITTLDKDLVKLPDRELVGHLDVVQGEWEDALLRTGS